MTTPTPDQNNPSFVRGVNALRAAISGRVLLPDDPEYAQLRLVWNGMIDKCPAVIAQCACAADVMEVVRAARQQGLPLAVRGGGHNVAGMATCDQGILLDLAPMRRVEVDTGRRLVSVEGGATLGDLDAATQVHGLAVPAGVVSETGIAGLTLSGGLGFMRRKYGLTCDNVVAADVVMASGELLHTSETESSDLLWALKGGGGNFGVVTRFWFRAYPIGPDVFHLFVFFPHDRGADVLARLRDDAEDMPDEMSIIAVTMRVPDDPRFPDPARGRQSVALLGAYVGEATEGERMFAPWRNLTSPLADSSGIRPYVAMQKALDEDYPQHDLRYYWKSKYMKGLPDEAIVTLLACAERAPSKLTTIDVWQLGGAIRRRHPGATALGDLSSPFLFNVESNWVEAADDQENITWTRETLGKMGPWLREQAYLNFPGLMEERQTEEAFGDNWGRLRELKKRYDPENLFRLNNNIAPAD